ncbi:hypothetical protein [Streptomyces sp. NPDC013455]|uniref:hypothetical protein n=1 Tax=Streptomyces sp. NPDC013455 TaxID=3155605 RepID=UPI0033F9993E
MALRQLTTAAHARRVLFAPVPVAPTKPLTLSHVKGLLWSDVMHRATGQLHHVDLHYSWSVGVLNAQTLGFWDHLDRTRPGADFSRCDEEEIGALYVEYQRGRSSGDRLDPAVRRAAEAGGPPHPAGARILDLWGVRLRELGIADPGLRTRARPPLSLDQLVALLADLGLCVDHRRWNGPVYLDGTRGGLPLRLLVGADGTANYLAWLLRDLIPHLRAYDDFVLTCDRDTLPDHVLLRHVLGRLGARVHLVALGRVRTGGAPGPVPSSRHGGWQGLTAAALAERHLDRVGPDAYRLGLRLYFVAMLGRGDRQPYRAELLNRCMERAARVLKGQSSPPDPADTAALLRRHARPHPYVDPYRLTTALLGRSRRGGADGHLLNEVYL